MISVLIFVLGLVIVGCYFISTKTGDMTWFRRSNAFLGPLLVILLILNGAWAAIVVPSFFAGIEWWHFRRNRRSKRLLREENMLAEA